jgi:hypothetical protein
MDLPAILHLKAQDERRKRSANLPKTVRTSEQVGVGGGQWPVTASHDYIFCVVTVRPYADVSFEGVVSSSRFSPLCPAALQRW